MADSPEVLSNEKNAIFSDCRIYRYALWRRWGSGDYAMFIGLNPSTADEANDDPTVRRCIAFAKTWGYGALCMANLFAYRSPHPEDLRKAIDPIGRENDSTLQALAHDAAMVIAAWGTHGTYMRRDKAVRLLVPELYYLRLTKDGHPGHPLYLSASLKPQRWLTVSESK